MVTQAGTALYIGKVIVTCVLTYRTPRVRAVQTPRGTYSTLRPVPVVCVVAPSYKAVGAQSTQPVPAPINLQPKPPTATRA